MSKTKEFKTKEALRSSCLSKALADWIGTYSDKEIHRFYEAMDNYAEAYASQLHPSPTPDVTEAVELDDLMKIRNYFGENDKTPFEHWAYDFLTKLYNKLNPQP